MRQSQYFLKTSKTVSKDDVSDNARLLEQGGFIQKVMAGVYSFLPLGHRVLAKIENIVREEMDALGANELLMPAMQPKDNWEKTGRWGSLDILFKVKSQHGYELALGPTHEEIVTPMAQRVIFSYKDMPQAVYQIQTKFRDEPRAKSGLLRGREFRMKDLYSFHADEAGLDAYYEKAADAYRKIFQRLGLEAIYTEASGGSFTKFSHEFQTPIENGEDVIYLCQGCKQLAKNKEIFSKDAVCTNCGKSDFAETKASEVGNIFKLKTRFSEAFGLNFTAEDGSSKPVIMGCYGLGPSRVMGVIVEKFHDDKGIIWPEAVAPFAWHLLLITKGDPKVKAAADQLYNDLRKAGLEVLYDDRDKSPGEKFADSDLFGIPHRLVVSERNISGPDVKIELEQRSQAEPELMDLKEFKKRFLH